MTMLELTRMNYDPDGEPANLVHVPVHTVRIHKDGNRFVQISGNLETLVQACRGMNMMFTVIQVKLNHWVQSHLKIELLKSCGYKSTPHHVLTIMDYLILYQHWERSW